MDCHQCGKSVDGLPFRCNYCGNLFCGEHRLPETSGMRYGNCVEFSISAMAS
ncbi:MAG: hypothetical protein JRN15_20735, partial [Nitrososphaerota archaeon]|nr:hypothetical protein [Nitrososphaerota archaeon]